MVGVFVDLDDETSAAILRAQVEDIHIIILEDLQMRPDDRVAASYWVEGIGPSRKRSRENDDNPEPSSAKRIENGAGKTIDLTQTSSTFSDVNAESQRKSCISCADETDPQNTSTMPGSHDCCHFCVQRIVIMSLIDETLYAPCCCEKPFDMDVMRGALKPELISGFYEKKIEFEKADRTHCYNRICSAFLYPANSNTDDCPRDVRTQEVLALADTEGWKRCEKCSRMIELKFGCNHITCACKTEWCYTCGVAWKECQCPTYVLYPLPGHRLLTTPPLGLRLDRATHIAYWNPQPAGPARQVHVVGLARAATRNHVCDHRQWARVGGAWSCDHCGNEMPLFVWRCAHCGVDACTRCRNDVG
ncbi:unnamed protein product [Diplocarpon coronariae]